MTWSPTPRVRMSWLCPPETRSARNGNRTRSVPPASLATNPCASMWWTGTIGILCAAHTSCAATTPTRRHMERPGPTVTATASSRDASTPAFRSAVATTSSMAASCASRARFGTTPPHGAWMASCDVLASPRTRPSPVTTATPVSSHDVSMPRMRVSASTATVRPSGSRRSGERGPEPNPVARPVRPSMRARRSETPPAANPREKGSGRERRAAGR
mmetsp:Transcript_10277/g.42494  ORF Transcript_10277/g.42494 Transcript_10277/m.42494 type:complete len:216 (-) Transcript_10277:162-809(-)